MCTQYENILHLFLLQSRTCLNALTEMNTTLSEYINQQNLRNDNQVSCALMVKISCRVLHYKKTKAKDKIANSPELALTPITETSLECPNKSPVHIFNLR